MKQGKSLVWKAHGSSLGGPANWGVRFSPQGRANSNSQVVEGSGRHGVCLEALWRKAQKRMNGLYQHFCLWDSCSSNSCPDARQFSSSLYVSGAFPAAAPMLELRVNESKKSVCGHFKRNAWDSRSLGLTQPQSLLVFTARCNGTGTLGWGAWWGAGTPHSSRGISVAKLSLLIFICHT